MDGCRLLFLDKLRSGRMSIKNLVDCHLQRFSHLRLHMREMDIKLPRSRHNYGSAQQMCMPNVQIPKHGAQHFSKMVMHRVQDREYGCQIMRARLNRLRKVVVAQCMKANLPKPLMRQLEIKVAIFDSPILPHIKLNSPPRFPCHIADTDFTKLRQMAKELLH